MYDNVQLFIAGTWRPARAGGTLPVVNPATQAVLGTVAHAEIADLEEALEAASNGFASMRNVAAFDRSKLLRTAAAHLRERVESIAPILTQEQGKPIEEARLEIRTGADILEWFAEEARRTYGRVIPARTPGVRWWVDKEPVGPVAAFTPWNFPVAQAARKLGAALAAGCSVILKGPEETPGSNAALVRALGDAGLPAGAVNLVFGVPAVISQYLIPHPVIRKVSFTGSTAVGKQLAALAGAHMKRVTMELGGHAPVIIFDDTDIERSSKILALGKYRNAGQVCVSPTRFLVQESIYDRFVERFTAHARDVRVGNGLDAGVTMGPLANPRRQAAMESLVADARQQGATLRAGGGAEPGAGPSTGNYFRPTVLADVPIAARAMNEEPFGPVALFSRFTDFDQAITEANRLSHGLAAYVYTNSISRANTALAAIESGMVSVNHQGLGMIETPFGGIKDSGYGSEGGAEAIEAYLVSKFTSSAS
jgi:succinate-semialdehyde dehydrogenase / glutarate-semialdehyde dehydrogenase